MYINFFLLIQEFECCDLLQAYPWLADKHTLVKYLLSEASAEDCMFLPLFLLFCALHGYELSETENKHVSNVIEHIFNHKVSKYK